jgi:ABC-type multidrug transport system ATPase subunit
MTGEQRLMVRVKGVSKRYGRAQVLQDVSFDIASGSIVALLGGNGAGKTTTLKCMLGVIPFEGAIEIGGVSVQAHGKDARRQIGYVPQLPAIAGTDTSTQALTFIAELKGVRRSRIEPALELVNLTHERNMKVGELSGGMRQRLALAAALLADPPLLLLDEPTASLDIESRHEFQRLVMRLRDEGKTIVLSTHFLDRLDEIAGRALILHHGRLIFDGTPEGLAARLSKKKYVVNVNGDAPSEFLRALEGAGIGPERVRRAALDWEELLAAATSEEAER